MVETTCKQCGKNFQYPAWRIIQKFCSRECFYQSLLTDRNPKRKEKTIKICVNCGKEIRLSPWQVAKGQKYCSAKCANEFKIGLPNIALSQKVEKICKHCGKTYFVSPYRKINSFYCSGSCRSLDKNDELAGNWRGGASFEPYPPTFNAPFKRMIRERDNYTCALCGGYGNCVHHINYVKDDVVPENCVTLCRKCHSKTNSNREYWQSAFTKCSS